jgi:hypothetical protein
MTIQELLVGLNGKTDRKLLSVKAYKLVEPVARVQLPGGGVDLKP